MHDFERDSFGPRTIIICDQCEREFHVGCLRKYTMGSRAADAAAARDADAERRAAAEEEEAKRSKGKGKGKASAGGGAAAAAAEKAAAAKEADKKGKGAASTSSPSSPSSPPGGCVLSKLPDGDWLCSRDCHRIYESLHRVVAAGTVPLAGSHSLRVMRGRDGSHGTATALRAASAVLGESFDPILDAATGADLTHAMTWAQSAGDWDFSNMLCALLYHRGVPMAAATFRVFGPRLAEVPLIATRSCGRRQGHCRVLLNALERLFAQLGVATMSLPAAAETIATWQSPAFGFAPMAPPQLRAVRQELRVLVFPGTTVLCKPVRALRGPPFLVPSEGEAARPAAASAGLPPPPASAAAGKRPAAAAGAAALAAAGFALAGRPSSSSTLRLLASGGSSGGGAIVKKKRSRLLAPQLGPDGQPKKSRSGKRRKPGELSPTAMAALARVGSDSGGGLRIGAFSPSSPKAGLAASPLSKAAPGAAAKAAAAAVAASARAREKAEAKGAKAKARDKAVAKKLPSKLKPKSKLLKVKAKPAPKPKPKSRAKTSNAAAAPKKKKAAVIDKKKQKPKPKPKTVTQKSVSQIHQLHRLVLILVLN